HLRWKRPACGPGVSYRLIPQSHASHSAAPTCGHAVRVSLPGVLWQQTSDHRPAVKWPAPVWPSPQGSSVSGATRSRWRGWDHRWQYQLRSAVPASAFLLACVVQMIEQLGDHIASFSTPFQWGLVLSTTYRNGPARLAGENARASACV